MKEHSDEDVDILDFYTRYKIKLFIFSINFFLLLVISCSDGHTINFSKHSYTKTNVKSIEHV